MPPMPGSFGARLRLRREEQGLALSAIADELKIKPSLLEAVERDDVSHWPSGIYRRAFIRAYAHAIGLNPDVVVREFLDLYPDRDDEIAAAFASAAAFMSDNPSSTGGPPTRLRNIVGSAIGSLSRLGRGSMPQPPNVPRATPLSAPDAAADDIPPMPAGPPPRELRPPDAPREVVAHRTTVAVPPLPPNPPPAVEAVPEYEEVDYVSEVVADASLADDIRTDVDESTPANIAAPIAETSSPPPSAPVTRTQTDVEAAAPGTPVPADEQKGPDVDFMAVAQVCTGFASVGHAAELQSLLHEAATIVDASGLIVWLWEPSTEELRPALVVGYSEKVLAQLPTVNRDADNPTAAAFRSGQPCVIGGSNHGGGGALVVPLVEADGCAGVLAMEFQDGREQSPSVHAASMIFAAAMSQLVTAARPADAPPNPEILEDRTGKVTRPLRVRR
jgi:transcriptional regulator with XRE-family HTH domain